MRRDEAIRRLQEHRDELRLRGVHSLELFGSVARDEATEGSDVDLLVEFDRPVGYFDLFQLEDDLEAWLGSRRVDLVLRNSVIDDLKPIIFGEAIDVL